MNELAPQREPFDPIYRRIFALADWLDVEPAALPGTWERQISPEWRFVMNGHTDTVTSSLGDLVAPYHCVIFFRGRQVGELMPELLPHWDGRGEAGIGRFLEQLLLEVATAQGKVVATAEDVTATILTNCEGKFT